MCIVYTIFRVNHEVYEHHKLLNTSYSNNTSVSLDSNSASLLLPNYQRYYVTIYVILMIFLIFSLIIRSAIFVKITKRTSINLHKQMFNSIIRTTMLFFNTNSTGIIFFLFTHSCIKYYIILFYTGQILNRFSTDMGSVDKTLPNIFFEFIQVIN